MGRISAKLLIALLALGLLAAMALCVFVGPTRRPDATILIQIRLPRVVLGMLVGAALAAVGAAYQSLVRNPLADPYVLGTSSGAAVGALFGTQLRLLLPGSFLFSTVSFHAAVFLGAFGATASTYFLARTEGRVPVVNLLLSGVIVTTLCSAVIMLFFTLQSHDSFSVLFFLLGSLIEGRWPAIAAAAAAVGLGSAALALCARGLDAISLGEEKARSLGIEVEKFKLIVFALGSLTVSACVAVSGVIGFVGLIVPHMARLIVGPRNKVLLPVSALMGATLIVLTDALARTLASPIEIPVGILTSLMGAPFFLWLLKKRGKVRYF